MPKLESGIAQYLRIFIAGRIKFKPMGEVKKRIVSDFIIKEKINIKNIFACGNSQWNLDFLILFENSFCAINKTNMGTDEFENRIPIWEKAE